jgi:MOSC domain-containing protein YiiM
MSSTSPTPSGIVIAVHRSGDHSFSKSAETAITLVAGLGVEGDAHCGARIKHRSRVKVDPEQPNLRQVHLLQRELFDDVASAGFSVEPGHLGENITTAGIDLLSLPVGANIRIGRDALVVLTGLRNPCRQIDDFAPGLLGEVRQRSDAGGVIRKTGVMGVVVQSGVVSPDDRIEVSLPPEPHRALAPV